ncbi:response regulator, partial [Planctomycetota bacterium]
MRVLVVDDEKIKLISLTDDLAHAGFETASALNGQEAIDLLARDSFDVVVTDIRMSNIDGMELLKHIKRGKSAQTEVIMMTAY